MEKLIEEIMVKAYWISTKTKADVFINYQAHVNWLYVKYYKNGWKSGIDADFDKCINLKLKSISKTELESVLTELDYLEKGE